MIPPKTKKQIRAELDEAIQNFIQSGGAIEEIQKGISGKPLGANLNSHKFPLNTNANTSRTLLVDEIKALDERKKTSKSIKETPKPKKEIIYDDFGEPIREIWK